MFHSENSTTLENNYTEKNTSDLTAAESYSGPHFPLFGSVE